MSYPKQDHLFIIYFNVLTVGRIFYLNSSVTVKVEIKLCRVANFSVHDRA
jgi:hypothetical protein